MIWDANPLPATVASECFVRIPEPKNLTILMWRGFRILGRIFRIPNHDGFTLSVVATCVKLPFSSLGLACWTCIFVGVKSQSLHSSRCLKSHSNDLSTFLICSFLFKKSIDFGRMCLTLFVSGQNCNVLSFRRSKLPQKNQGSEMNDFAPKKVHSMENPPFRWYFEGGWNLPMSMLLVHQRINGRHPTLSPSRFARKMGRLRRRWVWMWGLMCGCGLMTTGKWWQLAQFLGQHVGSQAIYSFVP